MNHTKKCGKCRKTVPAREIQERYSFGVYAGKFCDACCNRYRDRCGMDGAQGNPNDLDEPLEPEPYYGMEMDQW